MSLRVHRLLKQYGQQKAVDDVSFSLGEGEIVGFLGPNGAGKSTTMKIATGFLPATSGKVRVAGYDVEQHPTEVKRRIGYLPEHNPLYLDMHVHEALAFTGGLYGLRSKQLKDRISEIIGRCGLGREQNKKIEALSKGYRQRVGLAQALIHDPQVLILDEPTSGLDPNQLIEIRNLIRDVSRNKTVLFSTHILQEVQAICDRVIIIHRGKIVADDRLENILRKKQGDTLMVEWDRPVSTDELSSLSSLGNIEMVSPTLTRITPGHGTDVRREIIRFAADRGIVLTSMKSEENSLENIFKELTTSNDSHSAAS